MIFYSVDLNKYLSIIFHSNILLGDNTMEKLLKAVIDISKKAGEEILKVYNGDISIEYKDDDSPLTEADKRAHKTIETSLKEISDFPILSEEGKDIPFEKRKNWEYFWLVDPLDGTKEFIKRNGEFTVNIALIYRNKPVFGVVYAPAIDALYYGGSNIGAFKIEKGIETKLPEKRENSPKITVVASKSHLNEETKEFIDMLKSKFDKVETVSIGSSLKFCLVAEGVADIYPRIAPTMEWDTAAAHAILNGAGGKVVKYKNERVLSKVRELPELVYNKENLLNPHFIAFREDVF